jgi:hypothetical protein
MRKNEILPNSISYKTANTPIGECFSHDNNTYIVLDFGICGKCSFLNKCDKLNYKCGISDRFDKKSVMFLEKN